jgi:hypothetical protein
MTEDELVERIMAVRTKTAAENVLNEVGEWLDNPDLSDAERFRVMYQAEFAVMMLGRQELSPPD